MDFHELQTKVHVGKDKTNTFGGYNYRTAEGILAAIKASLPAGATIVVTDELQELAGQIFVSAEAILTIDGQTYRAKGHALHPLTKKGMDPSQITGAASSYARKYALSGLMALDDGSVDPDAQKGTYEETDNTPTPPANHFNPEAERDTLKSAIEAATTLADLGGLWTANAKTLARLKTEKPPMFNELNAAKEERKAKLSPPPNSFDGHNGEAYQ